MSYFKYKSGSIWRKWDLHVHTPESHNFKGDWEGFEKQLKEADCDVIGINDYFTVAGYERLKKRIDDGELNIGEKTILPVVEMRMTDTLQDRRTLASTHFNFHIIFSEEINSDDIKNFIKRLKYKMTRIGEDYHDKKILGAIKVSFDDTINELKSDIKFKDKFLIWLPYSSYGGIEYINPDPNKDGWIKEGFIKKSDILDCSNKNQIDYFLWNSNRNTEEEYKKYLGNKKPCIKGSDSHDSKYPIGRLKDKDSNPGEKFCWIKADPTFEGLKQIVYEPEDRVKIQELKPEEKEDYQVIKKVRFIDDSFMQDEILLNGNLTTIIGGKSTGKSILLKNIAKAIDSNEVLKRMKEMNPDEDENEDESSNEIDNFIVTWKDGQESNRNNSNKVRKKIIYIPQSYLNRIVDKREDKTSIEEIIENILKQGDSIKKIFENLEASYRKIKGSLTEDIEMLFHNIKDEKELLDQIKELGDQKGIELEIEKLKIEILQLQKNAGMTEEGTARYNSLMNKISSLKNEKITMDNDLKSLLELTLMKSFAASNSVNSILKNISDKIKSNLQDRLSEILNIAEKQWQEEIKKELHLLSQNRKRNEEQLEESNTKNKPLIEKMQTLKSLNLKNEILNSQKIKLKGIQDQKDKLKNLKKASKDLIDKILKNHSEFYDQYEKSRGAILKMQNDIIREDLGFEIEIILRKKKFKEEFVDIMFDQRKANQFKDIVSKYGGSLEKNNFHSCVKEILYAVLGDKLSIKSSHTKKEVIGKLTENWFKINYTIIENGDKISKMSPGKKSLVLLKLLIDLDNSKCPILLDQPEDDLDNRSIYNELVRFIKMKKRQRQIIIVTHNSNLVVSSDSECVIVANQSGDKSKNKTYKFEYVQGALENAFEEKNQKGVLYQKGIRNHVCEILEGGEEAFKSRQKKYSFFD